MRICNIFDFQVDYMFYWWFHFEIEILVNFLFIKRKWTYILDLGPWRWSALKMGYMDKRPSKMQGLLYIIIMPNSGGSMQQFLVEI